MNRENLPTTGIFSLVNSLTGNLQKFGLDRVAKIETLEEVLQDDETSENPTQDCPEMMNQIEQRS